MLTRTLNSDHGSIRYYVSKAGSISKGCVVFSHGLGSDHSLFDPQLDAFADEFDIITWDIPMHGNSRPYKAFSLEAAAADLLAILDAERLYAPAALVGHSFGGNIHQVFASLYPERVRCLVSVCTLPLGADNYNSRELFLLRRAESAVAAPYDTLCRVFASRACLSRGAYYRIVTALAKLGRSASRDAVRSYHAGLTARSAPKPPSCPVLLVIGDSDRMPFVRAKNISSGRLPDNKLVILRHAGYYPNCDAAERFNSRVRSFIDDCPVRRQAQS